MDIHRMADTVMFNYFGLSSRHCHIPGLSTANDQVDLDGDELQSLSFQVKEAGRL
jgi:hypothetical protein